MQHARGAAGRGRRSPTGGASRRAPGAIINQKHIYIYIYIHSTYIYIYIPISISISLYIYT